MTADQLPALVAGGVFIGLLILFFVILPVHFGTQRTNRVEEEEEDDWFPI